MQSETSGLFSQTGFPGTVSSADMELISAHAQTLGYIEGLMCQGLAPLFFPSHISSSLTEASHNSSDADATDKNKHHALTTAPLTPPDFSNLATATAHDITTSTSKHHHQNSCRAHKHIPHADVQPDTTDSGIGDLRAEQVELAIHVICTSGGIQPADLLAAASRDEEVAKRLDHALTRLSKGLVQLDSAALEQLASELMYPHKQACNARHIIMASSLPSNHTILTTKCV